MTAFHAASWDAGFLLELVGLFLPHLGDSLSWVIF